MGAILESFESTKIVKRAHPRKPRRHRKVLKVDTYLFEHASTPQELVDSLERTNVKASEVKSLANVIFKKNNDYAKYSRYNHLNTRIHDQQDENGSLRKQEIHSSSGTSSGPSSGAQIVHHDQSDAMQDVNTTSKLSTFNQDYDIEEKIAARRQRYKFLWQYVVFLIYYKICIIRENNSFTDVEKQHIARNFKFKVDKVNILLAHLNELTLLDQYMEIESHSNRIPEKHILSLEVIMPFKSILPQVYNQLSEKIVLPFTEISSNNVLNSSPNTERKPRKQELTPTRNRKQRQAMNRLENSAFDSLPSRWRGETREITMNMSLRDHTVDRSGISTDNQANPLKRTAGQVLTLQGVRRKRRRGLSDSLNVENRTPNCNNSFGFVIPESNI